MELQWIRSDCSCLRRNMWEVQNQEQTQEVRLPEGMPDMGRVICAWGQPVLRSKEWRADGVHISGGVTAWVLYAPEDGSAPGSLEVWLPFQAKWSSPQQQREGTARICCLLRGVDARMLSARKLMIRSNVGILAEALEPTRMEYAIPSEVPQGVELLKKQYPVLLPVEAGEKVFTLEEQIPVPAGEKWKVLALTMQTTVPEREVTGGKAVFRGNGAVHLVYMTSSGKLGRLVKDIPFAQYADLDRDYGQEAELSVMMALSALEQEETEEGITVKSTLIAQYAVNDRKMVELVEDAYSPEQQVLPVTESLQLPTVLDRRDEMLMAEPEHSDEIRQVVDVAFYPEHPTQYREDGAVILEVPGQFQILYYDDEGVLRSQLQPWAGQWTLPAGENSQIHSWAVSVQQPRWSGAEPAALEAKVQLEAVSTASQGLPMVTGLQLGERCEKDPARPSLLVRRMEEESLWELAKACGSTVDAIRQANQLEAEPEYGLLLLIPVP